MIKQVIVIRKDLNMRKGKMCAQAAHASLKVFLDKMIIDSVHYKNKKYKYERKLEIVRNSPLDKWLKGKFTKIVVSCDSEEELITLYNKARKKNLLCSIITDAGLTEFHGVETLTAVAIGPAEDKDINEITGGLKLL